MALYDAYGKPIPTDPGTSPSGVSRPEGKVRKAIQRLLIGFRSLKPFVKIPLEILGIFGLFVGIFWGLVAFRQEISIEPYVSYDSKEVFQQQFTVTNNGPFNIYEAHYVCAVTKIRLNDGSSGGWPDTVIYAMFPVNKPFVTLHWKERMNTECDFITHFGQSLKSVNIEIIARYKRWMGWEIVERGQRFTGKRDSTGNFQWVYGSDSPSSLEPPIPGSPLKTQIVIPF